ncbi:DeoR family transcriptional regulator [Murinocardiopsis flavida]|uniref:DeoR family transcriptional regulator n=1 Tax=Murinocardiopsis flavida TaxID=645275 RepID=A0A2P8CSW8_9ACTN|nr:DeoR/GlpR family DNA-binding transcription regulator [Murinocardiopsis flavida]PSK88058.1 DeoR family transcriptional regulator [Murinocardiopsis flavida]
MDRHQRLTAVLDLLSERGSLTVDEAMADLGVSPATVRRDLDQLAQQQLLTRTRGGAVAATVSYDLPLRYKAGRQAPEKERIAQAVVDLIAPGSVVGLNGGTTTTNVARAIALHEGFHGGDQGAGVTVVTNALNIANELVVRPHVKLVVVGGVVRARSYELIGPLAARLLDAVAIDTAVIGVDGISAETGAAAFDEGEAAINALLAGRAERVVVAADSNKIGQRAFARILPLSEVDILVTDTGISEEAAQGFEQAGVKVIRA